MNTELKGIEKSFKATSTFIKVIAGIATAGSIILLVGAIIMFAANKPLSQFIASMPAESVNNISGDIFGVDFDYDLNESDLINYAGFAYGAVMLFASAMLAITIFLLKYVQKTFDEVLANGTPFTESTIKKFKIVGIGVTVFVFVASGIGTALFVGFFAWCIYSVFLYGAKLQKLADETL